MCVCVNVTVTGACGIFGRIFFFELVILQTRLTSVFGKVNTERRVLRSIFTVFNQTNKLFIYFFEPTNKFVMAMIIEEWNKLLSNLMTVVHYFYDLFIMNSKSILEIWKSLNMLNEKSRRWPTCRWNFVHIILGLLKFRLVHFPMLKFANRLQTS